MSNPDAQPPQTVRDAARETGPGGVSPAGPHRPWWVRGVAVHVAKKVDQRDRCLQGHENSSLIFS